MRVVRAGSEVRAGVEVKLDADATGGALSVLALDLAPGGGAPLHRHTREDEIIVVLEGCLRVNDEVLERGDLVLIPKGEQHAFTNEGDSVTRTLILCIPGGLEGFFRALDGGTDPGGAAKRFGLEFG